MKNFDLKKYLAEGKLFEAEMACPASTQNLKLNTKNRDASIKADYIKYGPLIVLLLIFHLEWMNVCLVKQVMMMED